MTFHGGEPLLAGAGFYRDALPRLQHAWQGRPVRFSAQSNLWKLEDAHLEVFSQYQVGLGTSLDGPQEINDAQRGKGYFRRTMAGIDKARKYGIPVGCIATFSAQTAPRWREVVEFFLAEGLSFSVHAALPVLGHPANPAWALSAEAYGELLVNLLDFYLGHLKQMRLETLDGMIRAVSAGKGGMCTFGDCLGSYLAVGPDGAVYPCQRFAGDARFRLGGVDEPPERLRASGVWADFARRQEQVTEACAGCEFLDICRGGCPYNVLTHHGQASFGKDLRDPYCAAYKRIYSEITERATAEVFADGNLAQVVAQADAKRGLLRSGRVLELMSKRPHPYENAQNAGQALAAVALAASGSPEAAAKKLAQAGLAARPERLRLGLENLNQRLGSHRRLVNNLYLHVTFACPQRCAHCYAEAGEARGGAYPPEALRSTALEAARQGFRHLVVTGGEPLCHPRAGDMLRELDAVRDEARPLRTVLRSSLSTRLDAALLDLLANCTDEVVVSLDGDEASHDARRGAGSYARTLANLRRLVDQKGRAEISLAAVLPLAEAQGHPGEHVRALADELGIRRVRFRPVLPLGRAATEMPDLPVEAVWGSLRPAERVAYGFMPAASCGMGQNLYVEPDGAAYPCYAWHGAAWKLGNILDEGGLDGVMANEAFARLGQATVDSNRACRECALRYLCGGACRAWNRLPAAAQTDLDAPPLDCARLHERARGMLLSALEFLEVPPERWLAAGLPIPDGPPYEVETAICGG